MDTIKEEGVFMVRDAADGQDYKVHLHFQFLLNFYLSFIRQNARWPMCFGIPVNLFYITFKNICHPAFVGLHTKYFKVVIAK